MEKGIKELLDEEIDRQIRDLSMIGDGKIRTEAVDNLTKLHKLRIDEAKLEAEIEERSIRRELDERKLDSDIEGRQNEETFKRNQEREDHKGRYFRYGLEAAGIVLPLVFYGIWMHKGFKFEETGSITSSTFRSLISRFRPTKGI